MIVSLCSLTRNKHVQLRGAQNFLWTEFNVQRPHILLCEEWLNLMQILETQKHQSTVLIRLSKSAQISTFWRYLAWNNKTFLYLYFYWITIIILWAYIQYVSFKLGCFQENINKFLLPMTSCNIKTSVICKAHYINQLFLTWYRTKIFLYKL